MKFSRRRSWSGTTRISALSALPAALIVTVSLDARADPPSLLDRAVVAAATRHAIQRAGLGLDGTHDLSSRARAAGWVPRVALRVRRGFGSSAALSLQTGDRVLSDDSLILDARLTFSLDRVVFDPSEVAISRIELERAERRAQIEREVIDILATMEHARLALLTLDEGSENALRTNLEYARSRARLELMTGVELRDLIRGR
jgi:hypothetical protein